MHSTESCDPIHGLGTRIGSYGDRVATHADYASHEPDRMDHMPGFIVRDVLAGSPGKCHSVPPKHGFRSVLGHLERPFSVAQFPKPVVRL